MDWVRLDVGFWRHPKVVSVGMDGAVLYLWGLTYAGEYETDGFLTDAIVEACPPFVTKKPRKVAAALVAGGLWEQVAGGFQIHDWSDRQPTKAKLALKRDQTRDRMSRWRQRKTGDADSDASRGGNQRVSDALDVTGYGVRNEDPGSDSEVGLDLEGGPGETNPDDFAITIDDRIRAKFGNILVDDQVHNFGRLCRSNRMFLDIWPQTFLEYPPPVISESLVRARDRDVIDVDHPRAWMESLMAEVAQEMNGTGPETVADSGQKRAKKSRKT
jgi:hypothetical protein